MVHITTIVRFEAAPQMIGQLVQRFALRFALYEIPLVIKRLICNLANYLVISRYRCATETRFLCV